MSVDKYASIFLREMEATVYLSYAILSQCMLDLIAQLHLCDIQ